MDQAEDKRIWVKDSWFYVVGPHMKITQREMEYWGRPGGEEIL